MKISNLGLSLIKAFEGLVLKAYYCAAGVLTIGYGHTRNVSKNMLIDKHKAELLLIEDCVTSERQVNKLINVPINQQQFDALVSFVFNVGGGALERSTLRMKLNRGDYIGASKEFEKWCFAGGRKLKGLQRRRLAEKALFIS